MFFDFFLGLVTDVCGARTRFVERVVSIPTSSLLFCVVVLTGDTTNFPPILPCVATPMSLRCLLRPSSFLLLPAVRTSFSRACRCTGGRLPHFGTSSEDEAAGGDGGRGGSDGGDGLHYEDLFDSLFAVEHGAGAKFRCAYDDTSLSLVVDNFGGKEGAEEVFGTVRWEDLFLVNIRTTNWGPVVEDAFFDFYDVGCRTQIDGHRFYLPLSIPNGVGGARILQQMKVRGFEINLDGFNKAMCVTEHSSTVLYMNDRLCRAATSDDDARDGSGSGGGGDDDNDKLNASSRLMERARRAHYTYRSFFRGQTNYLPGLEESPPCDPRALLLPPQSPQ